jgi:hypothetical protein
MKLTGNFCARNYVVNPTMSLTSQKYSVLRHKHLGPINENQRWKNKGSYSSTFYEVDWKLLCSKLLLDSRCQSHNEFDISKI